MIPFVGTMLTAKVLVIGAAVAAVAITVASAAAGVIGYNKGVAADKQRSDLVITTMQVEAAQKLIAANALVKQQSDNLQATKERAEHDLQAERDLNKRLRDESVASAGAAERMRQRLAAAAAGGVAAGDDSVTSCRERAAAFGVVLGEALQAHALCTADIEDVAASYRAVRGSWPVVK